MHYYGLVYMMLRGDAIVMLHIHRVQAWIHRYLGYKIKAVRTQESRLSGLDFKKKCFWW